MEKKNDQSSQNGDPDDESSPTSPKEKVKSSWQTGAHHKSLEEEDQVIQKILMKKNLV